MIRYTLPKPEPHRPRLDPERTFECRSCHAPVTTRHRTKKDCDKCGLKRLSSRPKDAA